MDRPDLRVQREREPVVRATFAQPFHHEHGGWKIDLGATEFWRHRKTEYAELRAFLPQRAIESPVVIPLDERIVGELAPREFDGRRATRRLLVGQPEVHLVAVYVIVVDFMPNTAFAIGTMGMLKPSDRSATHSRPMAMSPTDPRRKPIE